MRKEIMSKIEYSPLYVKEKKLTDKLYSICCLTDEYIKHKKLILSNETTDYSNEQMTQKNLKMYNNFPLCPPVLLRETKIDDNGVTESLDNLRCEFIRKRRDFEFDENEIKLLANREIFVALSPHSVLNDWFFPIRIEKTSRSRKIYAENNSVFIQTLDNGLQELYFKPVEFKSCIKTQGNEQYNVYIDLSLIFDFSNSEK